MNWDSVFIWNTGMAGLIFFAAGWIMKIFPPKKINWLYGYRTKRAMKNQMNWDFAQKYSADLMWKMGLGLSGVSVLMSFLEWEAEPEFVVSMVLLIGTALLLFILTEKKLKEME